ncbi:MAG: hypothetical protein ACRDPP_09985 [Gaiellaceae bacterium]
MHADHAARPGLAEVLAVWALFGLVALAVLVAAARVATAELYNVSETGIVGGAGRALVFVGYPTAFVAIAILALLVARLRRRWVLVVAAVAAVLCATVAWPGVVEQSDLDAKPANAFAGVGALVAVALTVFALARGGIGVQRPFGVRWDVARLVLAVVLVLASIPWILADVGVKAEDVPGLGWIFMSGEVLPEPGHPDLIAVHLGHHHGMDGTLLALAALALSRAVPDVRGGLMRPVLGFYLSLMLVYGLANALQDFWLEQLVKRGTTSHRIPTLTEPDLSPAWAAIVAAALLIHFVARRVGTVGSRQEGVA